MTQLSAHFSLEELRGVGAPDDVMAHLVATAALLEDVRAVLGVPLIVTDGYRTTADNARVGGAPNSGHLTGDAADFVPQGMTIWRAATLIRAALEDGELSYGECIFYPFAHQHVHITVPGVGGSDQTLVQMREGIYAGLTDQLLATFPGAAAVVLAAGDAVTSAGDAIGNALENIAAPIASSSLASSSSLSSAGAFAVLALLAFVLLTS